MADIAKLITITQWGGQTGPTYDAYYSSDDITYTIATSGSNLYLPNIGSSATIYVPDTATYIRLESLSEPCGEVDVDVFFGFTTTTTTSTSTSTTSTSTTSTSTSTSTSTTTLADPFPSALNSGLIGRFEVTNVLSWPGSGVVMNNLATASLYSTSSTATIWSASAVDTTNGIQLNGTSTRVDFGIISTYNSGSYVMNSAMTASNEFTVVYLAQLDSTGGTNQVGLSAWNDYGADTGQSKYISLVERTSGGGTNSTSLRSNNSYNGHTIGSYYTNDVLKMYGTRLAFTTNGESYWRGTANVSNFTPTGTTLNSDGGGLVARNAPWTFGTRANTTLGGFYSRYWKGNLYAAYFWDRRLSDTEMGDLQTYLNTYVKANS